MADLKKTNAARLLDGLGISYELRAFAVAAADLSALAAAAALGVSPEQVFKTLVARGDRHGVLLACIPASAELALKPLAALSGNKHMELVPLKDVQPLTGYIRGGCSPLAAKKTYPVYIDASAVSFSRIYVSAGRRGLQLHMAPADLIRAAAATVGAISTFVE